MKGITRRSFLKGIAGLLGLLSLSGCTELRLPWSKSSETKGELIDGFGTVANSQDRWAYIFDVGACIGCRRCMYACKQENNVPDTISPLWIEMFEMKSELPVTGQPSEEDLKGATTSYTESPKEGRWYLSAQCNHCANPPCVKVCPTGATYKDIDGLVLIDYNKCIGCRYCVVACPYEARRFNWWKPEVPAERVNELVPLRPVGVVEKCTFCVHRIRRGKLPACVEACPVQARHFGKLSDPDSEVSKILNSNRGFRLLEELGTHPRKWYITRGEKWLE